MSNPLFDPTYWQECLPHMTAKQRAELAQLLPPAPRPRELLTWTWTYLRRHWTNKASRFHRELAADLDAISIGTPGWTVVENPTNTRQLAKTPVQINQTNAGISPDALAAWRGPQPTPPAAPPAYSAEPVSELSTTSEPLLGAKRGARLNFLSPRGSGKSFWVALAFPLRELLEGREKYVVIISDTDEQAKKFIAGIAAELEFNDEILAAYPEAAGRGPQWRVDFLELRNGCAVEALSTGKSIRGRKHKGERPTLVLLDDLQKTLDMRSATQRANDYDWYLRDVRLVGSPTTNFVHVGTALHQEAIACQFQRSPEWTTKVYRAIEKWPDRMDLWNDWKNILFDYTDDHRRKKADAFFNERQAEMTHGSKVLWPSREPLAALMLEWASIGQAAFDSEKQNNPVDPSQVEWPAEYFEHGLFWFDDWPQDLSVKVIFLDPSKGQQSKQHDYQAIVRYGRDRQGYEYVEADMRRQDVDALCATSVQHVIEFQPEVFGLEAEAWQELLMVPLKQKAELRKVNFAIRGIKQGGIPKEVRIRRLTDPLAQRKMRFKRRSPGTQILVDQLKQFPIADHDDGPDALEGARRIAIQLFNGRVGGVGATGYSA